MRLQTVIDTLGLDEGDTLESLKSKFREMAKRYHPDLVGNNGTRVMQLINEAYNEATSRWHDLMDFLMSGKPSTGNELLGDKLLRVYEALKRVPGIELTLIGSWLWITGDTKPVRETIKEAGKSNNCGVGFSRSKLAWYVKPEKYHRKGKSYSFNEIKSFWGSQNLQKEEDDMIA